ncbi:MAG TPA: tRNA lysidine(34) synthetase TilS, partial [Puia sp.]|nr:tRNA lysidine(34) synthetase TilS [Puia sp.]
IQAAARELRYDWFDRITGGKDQPALIVTAHHLDDNIETLVMNFFKGTGIAGLRGMLPRQGKIARPLLFAGREDIRGFAAGNGLSWVEDSSNESDSYTRNFFRHRILPLIAEAYPAALQNLAANLDRFRGVELLYRQAVEAQRKKLLEHSGDEHRISIGRLKMATPLTTLLYEIFSAYGFTPQQTPAIASLLDSGSGKYVCSATHRILRNRSWLIVSPLETAKATTILIESGENAVQFAQGSLLFQRIIPAGPPPAEATIAWLDAKHIVFPLILRPWQPGDYFYPLGMRKKKKLARFFIDQKLSMTEKEKTWVLEMNKKIVWVIGRRIDDRFRITPSTKDAWQINFRTAAGLAR